MKKSVLVIEDKKDQLEMLKKLVLEVNAGATVYAVRELKAAYQVLLEKTIDAFLVDIILDASNPSDASGIRLVEKIRTIPKYMFTPVIFITSVEDTTKYAYTDLNCLGYVEKPFSVERVKQLVEKALYFSTRKDEDVSCCFRKDGILYPVKVKNIIYMESRNHVLGIHTANGGTLSIPYKTCKQVLEEVDVDCLVQCSRNTIVNKDYILNVDITNRFIALDGVEEKIEIGITFKKKILAEFGL